MLGVVCQGCMVELQGDITAESPFVIGPLPLEASGCGIGMFKHKSVLHVCKRMPAFPDVVL